MGYRELSRMEIVEVVRRWQAGESQRGIAPTAYVASRSQSCVPRAKKSQRFFTIPELGAGRMRSEAASVNRKSIGSTVNALSSSATTLTSIAE